MADDLTDPGWWPTPPPDPPKQISTATIVLGTIVPIAVIAMLVLALVTHKSHSKAPARSLAAFQSCLGDQGVMTSSAESNDALLRQAAIACRGHVPLLPTGVDETRAAQQQLQDCQNAASAKLRNSAQRISPFLGPPSRQGYENAIATCRAESMVLGSNATPGGVNGSSGSVA